MKIAVLITTLNRPDVISDAIASILNNTYKDFELIIVDQSTNNKTQEIVERYILADKRVRYLPMSTRGKTKALNYGIRNCNTDIIAITDDDCMVSKDWIEKIVATFRGYPDLALLFGSAEASSYDTTKGIIPTYLPLEKRFFKLHSRFAKSGGGANMVIRENIFDTVGGFDEKLGPGTFLSTCEEYDFFYRVRKKGFEVGVLPSLKVVHYGLKRFEDLPKIGRQGLMGHCAMSFKYIRCGDFWGVCMFFRGLISLCLLFGYHLLFVYKYFFLYRILALTGGLFIVIYCALYGILLGQKYRIDREKEVFI